MRQILKGKEPSSLTEYRASGAISFDEMQDKAGLRASLVREQRGLCCYCLCRIRPSPGSAKIEHWYPQKLSGSDGIKAHLILDYKNLLAACKGGEGDRPENRHCDTSKGISTLSRNPADPLHAVDQVVSFRTDGSVHSSDPNFDKELGDVLNLNSPFLKRQRKSVLDAFRESLRNDRVQFDKELRAWNGDDGSTELRPYCQIVVYWLRRRIARGRL